MKVVRKCHVGAARLPLGEPIPRNGDRGNGTPDSSDPSHVSTAHAEMLPDREWMTVCVTAVHAASLLPNQCHATQLDNRCDTRSAHIPGSVVNGYTQQTDIRAFAMSRSLVRVRRVAPPEKPEKSGFSGVWG